MPYRHLNIVLVVLLPLFLSCTPQPAPDDSFRFVFMTDIHVQPERNAEAGFRQAISRVNELNPDFVITGGDLVYDALDETYERATMLYELYLNVCADFRMPVYHTFGNHEAYGIYEESGIGPEHPEYGREMFKKHMETQTTYYAFDYKGWHFILLDAVGFTGDRSYNGYVDSTQLNWLAEDLAGIGTSKPIIVSIHIPLVSVYPQMDRGVLEPIHPKALVNNNMDVIKAFEGYNLKLVLQGHLHCVEEIIYNDVHYITGGAVSANWWRGPRSGFEEGFVIVDVTGNDFTWEYIDYDWEVTTEE